MTSGHGILYPEDLLHTDIYKDNLYQNINYLCFSESQTQHWSTVVYPERVNSCQHSWYYI